MNKFTNTIPLPTADETGKKTFVNVNMFPKDTRSFRKGRFHTNVEIRPGQCAKLN